MRAVVFGHRYVDIDVAVVTTVLRFKVQPQLLPACTRTDHYRPLSNLPCTIIKLRPAALELD